MNILSFDQASVKTAWSFFTDLELCEYSLIHIKEKDKDKRFNLMCKEIQKIIQTKNPNLVVFEDVSLQTNVTTLTVLARLQGCIISECLRLDIPFVIYKPTAWRKILNFQQGRGVGRQELKKQALDYIEMNYDLVNRDLINDDIAEAICIGSAYIKKNY